MHLFGHNLDQDHYFELPHEGGAGCPINYSMFYFTPSPVPSWPACHVEQLEKGVRPWVKPWNVEHAAGRSTRPLRHNGQPYSGINVLSLWMSAELQSHTTLLWMTFRQAGERNAPSTTEIE
jgi:hypothetical protein